MKLKILTNELLKEFVALTNDFSINTLKEQEKETLPVDYFQFYKSISSVYSSKIEGEDIDFDSYFKHKFLGVPFKPDYTRKADDLYAAYDFIENHTLNLENVQKAHALLSANLLPVSQQGLIRRNPMFVLNHNLIIFQCMLALFTMNFICVPNFRNDTFEFRVFLNFFSCRKRI